MALITQKNPGSGDFGKHADAYKKGRRGVPDEVIDYLWSMIDSEQPLVLDIGCGTGIPTRQLAERGARVSATDIDAQMIKTAREDAESITSLISYEVAPADRQPYVDNTFDAVTIFGAFHWFTDAALEIRRVLKPGGTIFVVNKNDDPAFLKPRREILSQFIGVEVPSRKASYRPQQILQTAGFEVVTVDHFAALEFYTLPEMMAHVQSISAWNLIPESKQPAALIALQDYYTGQLVDGLIERRLDIVVQVGRKS